ncbi:MAG: hypothetical protein GC152_01635 [Alphaproteobacteria bacterium]|nr:hypothetical protein [Alphaproteobacteria bacterium]
MAQAQEEENHWPGFVDALSTIVMVVTFLLIILAIAIFVMSLQIASNSSDEEASRSAALTSTNLDETETIAVEKDPAAAPSEEVATKIIEADGRFMIQFSGQVIKIDEAGTERLSAFASRTEPNRAGRNYLIVAYFDPSIAYTKAQRIAYYRLLSARSALSAEGVSPEAMTILVREAPTLDRIDTVEITIE